MRILLDTHIYLWWMSDDKRLSTTARQKIANAHEVYISSASIWELAIKVSLGKLAIDIDECVSRIRQEYFIELPVAAKHAATVRALPQLHGDPFDRMLVAQAICEPLHLLTHDTRLAPYSNLVDIV